MKKIIALFAVIIALGLGFLYFAANMPFGEQSVNQISTPEIGSPNQLQDQTINQDSQIPEINDGQPAEATSSEPTAPTAEEKDQTTIGKSVQGRDIIAYHFGAGAQEIILVGGIHGGYAWNTALLGYEIIDYLKANPDAIGANAKITVIPALNIDGLNKVVDAAGKFSAADISASPTARAAGRFNTNNVDLNRNFDCDWKETGLWQSKTVSGGTAAFSEPETAAIKNYVQENKPAAVVAWYVSGGGVYASSCGNGILPETQTILDLYANASGYPAHKNFESYQVSGDMTDWFAKNGIPAIGVLLKTADKTEWSQNWAGINAILKYYSE